MSEKKPTAQWLLRFQAPNVEETGGIQRSMHFPILAKFSDPLNWPHLLANRKDGMFMYYQNEEIRDDENDETVVRDAEFFKKRRAQQRQRRIYRKKQLLVFECPKDKIYFEGKENNLDISELETPKPVSSSSTGLSESNNHDGGSDFRYVLFKFVKKVNEAGEEVPEILVTPVSSMFTLRKTGRVKDTLLSEIEERYIEERKLLQKQLSKYRTIVSSLQKTEGGEGGKTGGKIDYVEDISETDLFKQALQKAFGHKLAKLKESQRRGGRRGMGPALEDSEKLQGDSVKINDVGIDMDELKEFEYCGGDYEKNFADDEEDNVVMEQMFLDAAAASEISTSWRNDLLAESSEEDEDEEEEGKEKGDADEGAESGIVNQFMLDEVDEAMEQYKHSTTPRLKMKRPREVTAADGKGEGDDEVDFGITNDNEGLLLESNTRKNAQVTAAAAPQEAHEGETTSKEKKRARISFAESTNVSELPPIVLPTTSSSASLSSSGGRVSGELDLSEEGLRSFIASRGGLVEIKVIIEAFKSKVKAYSKMKNDKSAGKQKLLQIIEKITENVEDPIRGNCLALKQK